MLPLLPKASWQKLLTQKLSVDFFRAEHRESELSDGAGQIIEEYDRLRVKKRQLYEKRTVKKHLPMQK